MIAAWALHLMVVSALLALAARAAEAVARLYGLPARWGWIASMAGSLVLPAAAVARGGAAASAAPAGAGAAPAGTAGAAGSAAGAAGTLSWWETAGLWVRDAVAGLPRPPLPDVPDVALLVVWTAASASVGAVLALGWLRWRHARRWWPERRVQGTSVRVSRATGPAVVGGLRPFIVLPAWLLGRDPDEVAMAVAHEREHLRARDPALLASGLALLCLTPWNPVSWWQFHRLRLAVEVDCDARMLEAGASLRRYGDFLIDVATADRTLPLSAATLGRRRSMLEGRIRTMTRAAPRLRAARAAMLALLAGGALLAACDAPPPTADGSGDGDDAPARAAPDVAGGAGASLDLASAPRFVPRDVDPRQTNDREVGEMLQTALRAHTGVGKASGTARVWVLVGRDGRVRRARIQDSSGDQAVDRAALEGARAMEFEPAMRDGEPVAVWISRRFRLDLSPSAAAGDGPPGAAATPPGSTVRITGDAPLEDESGPVIILDGRRIGGPEDRAAAGPGGILDRLDPSEIQEIEILKGLVAEAEYGPAAGRRGVLVITTKDRVGGG